MTLLSRHLLPILADKARKAFEPRLDPARAERVYREFGERRGYDAWHAYCRTCLRRPVPDNADATLLEQGFERVRAMSAAAAQDVIRRFVDGGTERYLKRDSRKLRGYRVGDDGDVTELLARALGGEVDALALRCFGAEYLVLWFTLSSTPPGAPLSVSFRWHCDKGPRDHLKLLVYLNDGAEHGGGTAFIDRADTAAVRPSGYLFGRGRRRIGDLDELARLAGRPLREHALSPPAGGGVLFQPGQVLHRGIAPVTGPRYVLTLCLLPSPVDWRRARAAGAVTDLAADPLWPPHADLLRHRIAAGREIR
ncbi:MAG: hypothetical protein RLW62_11750 [Gammaproteobacteria bacterium]